MGGNSEFPIDLGCGWLHSGDRNPWREIAEAQGGSIDKTPPPWTRHSAPIGFPLSDQTSFLQALQKFRQQLHSRCEHEPAVSAATFLDPLRQSKSLLDTVHSHADGAQLAEEKLLLSPALPEEAEAAMGLPLGLADKLFLSLAEAEEFDKESRLFGRTGRSDTGVYHFRPFGRPQIEAYFGGRLAAELEAGGEPAFVDFAIRELTGLLGRDFAHRATPPLRRRRSS